jgi:tetratricopeptide (TPR) repeat protein
LADIFVSYTSTDRDWALWIGQELKELGHTPHLHEWEIEKGEDILAWMEQGLEAADYVLCVLSDQYLKAPYSVMERNAATWRAAGGKRPGSVLFVVVKPCTVPALIAPFRRCELFGLSDPEKRVRFREFMGVRKTAETPSRKPGSALSNVPIRVPEHFLGRDDALAKIDEALASKKGRVAITALHGLRGVGKSTLAAAYAERHRDKYRATWWIRAQTDSTMRADLVALGVRLEWVPADANEEPALAMVMERLRDEGEGVLLIFDNAIEPNTLNSYLPRGGAAHVLVTSNARNWRGIAAPVEIDVWPKEVGADYLTARTGREKERKAAIALSEMLGGLPLAHEQAAAYCERLDISLGEYLQRFEKTPAKMLDAERDAPSGYGLTVAKTFELAIEQASKLHPAAEQLIVYVGMLAPEPIPLFLFPEAREKFGEPLASALADDGLDEVVAALLTFALADRETIPDERDPVITTECIRLHPLVRQVAAERWSNEARGEARGKLIEAIAGVYPAKIWRDPQTWPRVRRLDSLALALVAGAIALPKGVEARSADLLTYAGQYRHHALADYAGARPYYERALTIREEVLGTDNLYTAASLSGLARLLEEQGDFAAARPRYERALRITEKVLGPDHPETATTLSNLGALLQEQGDFAGALPLLERDLAISEKVLGPGHPDTATSLSKLAQLRYVQGDLTSARALGERALSIREKALGPQHPQTAVSLNNLASVLRRLGDLKAARTLSERALAIYENVLGPEHPSTATSLNNLALLLMAQGDLAGARPLLERDLAISERVLGPEHPDTATTLHNLARVLQDQGDPTGARTRCQRALAIYEKALGSEHPNTNLVRRSLARLLLASG